MKLQISHSYNSLSLLEPVWVVLALLIFAADPTQSLSIGIGLTLLALSFLQRWIATRRLSRPTVFDGPWAFLLAGAIISQGVSYNPRMSLPVLLMLASCVALYYAAANAPKPEVLAQIALLVGLAVAVYFLTQYQYILPPEKSGLASSLGRVTSRLFPRFGSWEPFSNGVATLLEGLIPLGVALSIAGHSRIWRGIAAVATGIMGLTVLTAASRGAWVALLATSVLWLISRWQRGIIVLTVVSLIAIAALGGFLILKENATLSSVAVVGPVLYQLFARPDRIEVYQGSLRLIQDFPLTGIGLGDVFAMMYSQYVLLIQHPFLTYSHNLYLTIWLSHGVLGVIGIGWLIAAFGWLVAREDWKRHANPLFQAAWLGVIATLVHGLFDARQYVDLWTMWPLFFLLGLTISTSTVETTKKLPKMALSRRWEWVVLGLLAAGCVVLWQPLMATIYANTGAVRQAKAELTASLTQDAKIADTRAAMASYERALGFDPSNRTAHLRLGNLAVAAGRYEEGVTHLEAGWQVAKKDPTIRKSLGLAYAWVGEIDKAAELLRDSRDIVAELNIWARWHAQQERQQVATNAYRTSLALKPDQPQVRDLLSKLESN